MRPAVVVPEEDTVSETVVVARVGRPHGLRGEVTVRLHTDEPERRLAVGAVLATEAPPGSGVPVAGISELSNTSRSIVM